MSSSKDKKKSKLSVFLNDPRVRKATDAEYVDFLEKYFKQGGELTFYEDSPSKDILIVKGGVDVPTLHGADLQTVIIPNDANQISKTGHNKIYNMNDGSVKGTEYLIITRETVAEFKFRGYSWGDIYKRFSFGYDAEVKSLSGSLFDKQNKGIRKLGKDFNSIAKRNPAALKRNLPLQKRIKF